MFTVNTTLFNKQLNNLMDYSFGFLEGIQAGKKIFLEHVGKSTIQALYKYIDIEARNNQQALHHVYEWYQTGSPAARLFDIHYTISGAGLSVNSTFRQSRTVKQGSSSVFYNKAFIMENGIPVTIKPKKSGVLAFENAGETVFTKKEVTVRNPGGVQVTGSFERVFDQFFKLYFSQAFLRSSGLYDYISNPTIYKKNFAAGAKGGKSIGISTGFKWITNAKIEVE